MDKVGVVGDCKLQVILDKLSSVPQFPKLHKSGKSRESRVKENQRIHEMSEALTRNKFRMTEALDS